MKVKDYPVSLTVAACITGAALAASVFADDNRPGFPIVLEELRAAEEARFTAADSDGDGLVSSDEFSASNRDRGWRGAGVPGFRGGERRDNNARLQRRVFTAADADGNGELSQDEFQNLPKAARKIEEGRMFQRLDRNEDGFLTPEEFPSRVDRLATLDANGDGQVTRDEMPSRGPRPR